MAEFADGHLGKIDAKTLQGDVVRAADAACAARGAWRSTIQDRIVVTEYRGNKVAMFDTRTEKFTEYPLPPYTFPVPGAASTRTARSGPATMHTDRVVRLDPKTGETSQYLMPSETNMRTRVRRQFDDAGDVLGRLESRPRLGQGRAAGLSKQGMCPGRSAARSGALQNRDLRGRRV